MMPDTRIAEDPSADRSRIVELIAAPDRRVAQVERVSEISIARAASALRFDALKRIEELEREAPPVATL
jgi:hypothetical protein